MKKVIFIGFLTTCKNFLTKDSEQPTKTLGVLEALLEETFQSSLISPSIYRKVQAKEESCLVAPLIAISLALFRLFGLSLRAMNHVISCIDRQQNPFF